ncbi:type II toxin-antitoxin system Phd/YefM family antitoxin [Streptosporangium sandarakinum]|uniref:Antitoxin n=1 Tax=Streptosporangium sandarakinum TaxID=1260955 RepID=A0A852V6Z0_9ACTN|nr:type II toxin-antitoxin system Phd/YefM family antitoxin [Streptosporangium sandarakinum]NYF42121.1 prevent-host-death family protein [Streptosporangium sandarakinum]
MTVLPLADARARLSGIVESAVSTHERFEITRNGVPAAVLLAADEYETMREMIDILASTEVVEAIREGLADLEAGCIHSQADVEAELRRIGRL